VKNVVGALELKMFVPPVDATTGLLVNEKLPEVAPEIDALTMYDPATLFAAGTGDAARPDEFVTTVAELLAPNVALAPLEGAANVTVAPETGFPAASVTFA